MIICGIYKITNVITYKVYVGSSIDIQKRKYKHFSNYGKSNQCKRLKNSILKYGVDNFILEVIEECPKEKLIEREQYWMDFYKSYERENGYNILKKSYSSLGYKHNEDAKVKISKIHKNKKLSSEHKKAISDFHKGIPKSEEFKMKNSTSLRGSNNGMFGKTISSLQRESIIKSNINRGLKYKFINPEGEIVEIKGLESFCKENNLCRRSMNNVNSDKIKQHKGWKKYIEI